MRKSLLFLAALTAASSLHAKNQRIEDMYTLGVSPDGRYIHGSDGVYFLIRDILEDITYPYDADYSAGNGNCWTTDGTMAGNIDDYTPALWKAGKWKPLNIEDASVTHILRGITPDGKYICGTKGEPRPTGDVEDYLMAGPAVWELQEDGNYSQPISLPHPELDITGRVPQYITANNISDDGKTIIGQIVDGNGFFIYPIAYYKDDKGEWSYEIVQPDVFNPQNVTFPTFPGSGPAMPMAESYLTPEQNEAYEAAMQEWDDHGSDYSTMPDPADFLEGDSLSTYEQAMEEYNKVYPDWEKNFVNWWNSYNRLLSTGYTFAFNDLYLSPDGKYYGCSAKEDVEPLGAGGNIDIQKKARLSTRGYVLPHDGNSDVKYTPVVFNLTDDSHKVYHSDFHNGIELTGILSDGTVVGVNEPTPYPQAYLYLKGDNTPTALQSYIGSISKECSDWMNVNMTHDVDLYDPENDNYQLIEDYMITGIPYVTPDLKTIVTTAYAVWTAQGSAYFTYVLTPDDPDKIETLTQEDNTLHVNTSSDGSLKFNRPVDVKVYGLTGSLLYIAEEVTTAATNLPEGIYVIKANDSCGNSVTKKIKI